MIELILICFFGAVFYAGFKAGSKYKTIKDLAQSLVDRF